MIPYRDTIPCQHTPWVTWSLVVVNFGVFIVSLLLPEAAQTRLFYWYGLVPARYASPEWAAWAGLPGSDYTPFVTSMFLHGSWLHLVSNMWLLWIFGDNIEDRMGPARFVVFYLVCGFVAGALQIYFNPGSTVPAIGASGGLAGIMGAFFFLYPYARIVIWVFFMPLFIQVPAIGFLGLWVIFQLYKATAGFAATDSYADIAWWGHLGGFIAGMLLYRFFLRPEQPQASGSLG